MRNESGVYLSHLSPKEHAAKVQLVGRKCIVHCELNGQATENFNIPVSRFLLSRGTGCKAKSPCVM